MTWQKIFIRLPGGARRISDPSRDYPSTVGRKVMALILLMVQKSCTTWDVSQTLSIMGETTKLNWLAGFQPSCIVQKWIKSWDPSGSSWWNVTFIAVTHVSLIELEKIAQKKHSVQPVSTIIFYSLIWNQVKRSLLFNILGCPTSQYPRGTGILRVCKLFPRRISECMIFIYLHWSYQNPTMKI